MVKCVRETHGRMHIPFRENEWEPNIILIPAKIIHGHGQLPGWKPRTTEIKELQHKTFEEG